MAQTRHKTPPKEAPIPGARILLIEARYHERISDELVAGARARLEQAQVEIEHIRVPGSLEIPVTAAIALAAAERSGKPFDGVVALGCVIRGKTEHFKIVARESARALIELAVARRVPIGNGILAVYSESQALERARRVKQDKGGAAASAALALVRLARARKGA
jgi:6,7-dimethyl-8-ribityllumazine synthase